MKSNYLIILSIFTFLFLSCDETPKYYDGIFIVGADKVVSTVSLTVDELPSSIGVNVASSRVLDEAVSMELEVDEDLVANFNKEFSKNYELLPTTAYQLHNTSLTIHPGTHITDSPLKVEIISKDVMKEGVTYLLPISIERVTQGSSQIIEGSRTIYVVVNQIIITKAANLKANYQYFKVDFAKPSNIDTKSVNSVTYEARVRFPVFNDRYWTYTIMGLEENFVLRLSGGKGSYGLQVAGSGVSLNSTQRIPVNKWVHLACVYNGTLGVTQVFIDGELQAETTAQRQAPTIDLTYAYLQDMFFIGQSAADTRYLQGYISEARVWGVARTASELKNNVCYVDPTTKGLLAYWRFNTDTELETVTDLTGNGFEAKYTTRVSRPVPLSYIDGVRCPDE